MSDWMDGLCTHVTTEPGPAAHHRTSEQDFSPQISLSKLVQAIALEMKDPRDQCRFSCGAERTVDFV